MSLAVRGGMTAPVSSGVSTTDALNQILSASINAFSQNVLNRFYAGPIKQSEHRITKLSAKRDKLMESGKWRQAGTRQVQIDFETEALARVRRQVTPTPPSN